MLTDEVANISREQAEVFRLVGYLDKVKE